MTGISYEPWHYRYVGEEVAKDIYMKEICLEEYFLLPFLKSVSICIIREFSEYLFIS